MLENKFGKKAADYHWNKRIELDKEKDRKVDIHKKDCTEISKKCTEFLKSRGVHIFPGY
jgi:thiamine biosynthesis protein ThiC